jgi:undecaprenyl-diphosphatase
MIEEIFLAIVQAATEFLPVSSSGHLALFSNLISQPNVFFFVALHFASLFAVLIYTRREVINLLSFDKKYLSYWGFLILGTIPAGIAGFFLNDYFEGLASNYLFLSGSFVFTGLILLSTKGFKGREKVGLKSSFVMGLMQVLALLPGVSRSGMTISGGLFSGVKKEEAFRFSFLMFIPLTLGAVILNFGKAYFSWGLVVSFVLCFILSLTFLGLLEQVLKKDKFWMFGIYCILVGLVCLGIGLF